MASLRLVGPLDVLGPGADLDGVHRMSVSLEFDLGDLASINLDDGARHRNAPPVPEVSHADLVANQAYSS